jgi:predicted nucleic acid-binding protein
MKILVDVNVFEDVFRLRQGWEASLMVINEVRNGQATGYVSALTPPILYFFRRRARGEKTARQVVQQILQGFVVVSLTRDTIERAYATVLPDFEDALQLEAAKAANVEVVVTRNKKHFRQKDVQVLTPEEFVEQQRIASKS